MLKEAGTGMEEDSGRKDTEKECQAGVERQRDKDTHTEKVNVQKHT